MAAKSKKQAKELSLEEKADKIDETILDFIAKVLTSDNFDEKRWWAEFWAKYRWKKKKGDSVDLELFLDMNERENATRTWLKRIAAEIGHAEKKLSKTPYKKRSKKKTG